MFHPQTSTRSYLRVVSGGRSRSRQFLCDPAEFVVHFSPEGRGKGVFFHTIAKSRALLLLQSRENDVVTSCPITAGVKNSVTVDSSMASQRNTENSYFRVTMFYQGTWPGNEILTDTLNVEVFFFFLLFLFSFLNFISYALTLHRYLYFIEKMILKQGTLKY